MVGVLDWVDVGSIKFGYWQKVASFGYPSDKIWLVAKRLLSLVIPM